jgi:hypothetical protein
MSQMREIDNDTLYRIRYEAPTGRERITQSVVGTWAAVTLAKELVKTEQARRVSAYKVLQDGTNDLPSFTYPYGSPWVPREEV